MTTRGSTNRLAANRHGWTICLEPGGIVRISFADGTVQTLESAMDAARAVTEISQGVRRPALVDMRGLKYQEREARVYLASREGCSMTLAFALLVDSSIGKLLANFYFTVSPLPVPHKMFTGEREALAWLNAYRAPNV